MKEPHRLLARQLRRFIPPSETLPQHFNAFLEAVNTAYYENDEDRRMLERSLELSSNELLQSNTEMRAILRALPDHYFRINAEGVVLEHKPADGKTSPLENSRPVGKSLSDLVPEETAALFERAVEVTLQERVSSAFEYSQFHPEASLFFEVRLIPLFDDQLILLLRDITGRKRSEIAAQERAGKIIRYQAALLELSQSDQQNFDAAIAGMMEVGARMLDLDRVSLWLFNQEKTHLICENLYCAGSGTHEKSDGKGLYVSRYPSYFATLRENLIIAVEDVRRDPRMDELAAYFNEHEILSTMDAPLRLHGRVEGVLCMDHFRKTRLWSSEDQDFAASLAQMISLLLESRARKSTEEALKDREANLRTLLLAAPVGIAMQSSRRFRQVSRRFCSMLGYEEEELVGRSPVILYETFRQAKSVGDAIREQLAGQGAGHIETRWVRKDGKRIDVLLMAVAMLDAGPEGGLIFTVLDITERKRVEKALFESEKRFRNYFELSLAGIAITTPDMKWIEVNDRLCDLLGFTREELACRSLKNLVLPEEHSPEIRVQTDGSGGLADLVNVERRFLKKDGTHLHALVSSRCVSKESGAPDYVITLIQDVTDRKRLEAQLLQAQKMEAIGTLAGGIAHNFNNLLMGIEGYASLILYELDAGHPYYEMLRSVEELVRSGAELTKQLLGFAQGGKYEVKPTNVNTLIDRSSRLFSRTRPEIVLKKKLREDLWMVDADQGQIEQVLFNLYVNAWQAMPGGGTLSLRTDNVNVGNSAGNMPDDRMAGAYIRIAVTDTGIGMDEKTKERIFDPFFTTKDRGRGTGLGLPSAYGIIKNHGGFIGVYSEKGQGSTFNVYLPRTRKDLAEAATGASKELRRGTETVLVVDDEEINIQVTERILGKLGYRVITANSGREAVDLCRGLQAEIDLVILDMVMPGMDGGETYENLKRICPSMKCILASGYSINEKAANIMEKGVEAFIQKPFSGGDLADTVRRVLDGANGGGVDAPGLLGSTSRAGTS